MPRGSDKIKLTYSLVKTIRVHLSNTPETTNMPICKKSIKVNKYLILDMKKKLNEVKLDKRNLLWASEDEENSLLYQFRK